MKKSANFNFNTENNALYVNNIDLSTVKKLDIWMVRFILRANNMYTYGWLSPSNLKKCEKLIEVYKEYLKGGERDKDDMIAAMNKFTIENSGKRIKFNMMKPVEPVEKERKVWQHIIHDVVTIDEFRKSIKGGDWIRSNNLKKRFERELAETRGGDREKQHVNHAQQHSSTSLCPYDVSSVEEKLASLLRDFDNSSNPKTAQEKKK